MKLKVIILFFISSVFFSTASSAGDLFLTPEKVSGEIGLGTLSGKTKERVYDPDAGGRKVSQLDWKYNNAAIVKGSVNWEPLPWISLGASGWTTIDSRGGNMVDTDWLDESQKGGTDQSQHPNTRLNHANEFDLNVKGWLLNAPTYRLGLMAGYQESQYSFKATGGSYNYTNKDTGLQDIGTFPADQTVIAYKQHFKMPYIGFIGSYRYNNFEFGGAFKYSGWVRASDNDEHYLRDVTFKAKVNNQNYYSLAANIGYYVTPSAKVYVEGNWNRTTNKKGNLSGIDRQEQMKGDTGSDGGIENYSYMASVGLKYSF